MACIAVGLFPAASSFAQELPLIVVTDRQPDSVAVVEGQVQADSIVRTQNTGLQQLNVSAQLSQGTQADIELLLSNPNIATEIKSQGNQIFIKLTNSSISPHLLGQHYQGSGLLSSVVASNDGKDGVIVMTMKQDFDYQAHQTDQQVKLSVHKIQAKPLVVTEYQGAPISIDFQNVEVRSALHLLSQFTGLNIVASDQVTGSIMLNLVNVPWDQALDIILSSKQLGKQRQGNVILVAPLEEMAKYQHNGSLVPLHSVYIRPNYAKAADIMALITKASHSRGAGAINSGIAVASQPSAQVLPAAQKSTMATPSTVISAAGQTQHHPATLLSKRGVIAVDARTNTLIIKDTAASIENIKALIEQVDIPVRQVMIEARIVSASDSFSKEIGVKWGILSKGVANNNNLLVGGSDQTLADLKQFTLQNSTYKGQPIVRPNYNISRPDNLNVDLGVANPAGRIAFGLINLSDLLIDLELSAMQAEGRGEVISTPKILTLDKQTAKVSSGTKIPYQGESEGGGTTTQFEEAVLSLEVTPSITPDNQITLQIYIENGRPNPVSQGVILIDTDTLSTNVTVGAGQTIVLGGIYRNQIFNNVEKVPFFGDIPYLGRLFKKDLRRNDKQELLIFITPKLMNDSFLVTEDQRQL
ncbi:type IV pilus secretin PilQ [Psychrobacter sp. FDAARGOS_221]|nr:type IV pilus secretin PilQ [Psychrobacter sp. FDAARGOS_221]